MNANPHQIAKARKAFATHGGLNITRHIFLCAQKDGQVEAPGMDDLYPVGSVALILRLLNSGNTSISGGHPYAVDVGVLAGGGG